MHQMIVFCALCTDDAFARQGEELAAATEVWDHVKTAHGRDDLAALVAKDLERRTPGEEGVVVYEVPNSFEHVMYSKEPATASSATNAAERRA